MVSDVAFLFEAIIALGEMQAIKSVTFFIIFQDLLISIQSILGLHLALKDRFSSLPLHKYTTVHNQMGQKCHRL